MKDKILATAIEILREGGIKKLSQPEVCSILGIRQSQLTYYFPRRSDLIKAIVEDFTRNAKSRLGQLKSKTDIPGIIHALEDQMTRQGPMRGFLGLLIEADQEPGTAEIVKEHMRELEETLIQLLSEVLSPAQTHFLIEHMRGIGLSRFLDPQFDSKTSIKLLIQTLIPKTKVKKSRKER